MARKLPKPFKRPSIEVGVRQTRTWRDVCAWDLKAGDIVGQLGSIVKADPDMFGIDVVFLSGKQVRYEHDAQVFAFVEAGV